jgi:hypothetical protein
LCRRFIRLLLGDSVVAGRASPKTAIDEEFAEIFESGDIDARIPERQIRADDGVKHPAWHDDHYARQQFDVAHPDAGSHLAIVLADPTTVQSVPAIMNLDFMPDAGRMNG